MTKLHQEAVLMWSAEHAFPNLSEVCPSQLLTNKDISSVTGRMYSSCVQTSITHYSWLLF